MMSVRKAALPNERFLQSKVHFLFISTMEGVPWGGSEELWSRAAEELIERGHKVSFCTKCWATMPVSLAVLRRKGATAQGVAS